MTKISMGGALDEIRKRLQDEDADGLREMVCVLNGTELRADVHEQEDVFLRLASGRMSRSEPTTWVEENVEPSEERA